MAVDGTVSWVPQHGVYLIDVETPRGAQQHAALHTALSHAPSSKWTTDVYCAAWLANPLAKVCQLNSSQNLPFDALLSRCFRAFSRTDQIPRQVYE
jgi:hypothetical protein